MGRSFRYSYGSWMSKHNACRPLETMKRFRCADTRRSPFCAKSSIDLSVSQVFSPTYIGDNVANLMLLLGTSKKKEGGLELLAWILADAEDERATFSRGPLLMPTLAAREVEPVDPFHTLV